MLNNACLQGRLVRDIEVRETSNGCVGNFTLATDHGYGEKKKTAFINCVAWNKTAELMQEHTRKGSMVIVSGRIETRSYTAQDGQKRSVTEIVVQSVEFLDPREKHEEPIDEDLPF